MTARSTSLRFPEGTKTVGTARVREDRTVGRSFAEREILRRTGNQPHSEFDEIAGRQVARAVEKAARAAATIGDPVALDKPIARMTQAVVAKEATRRVPSLPSARRGKRLTDPVANFWSKVDRSCGPDACWPWIAKSRDTSGYGRIRFDFGSGVALRGSHQVAFFLSKGRTPGAGLEVLHSCDNKPCCNPRHLSEGTHSRNMEEAYARGRLAPKRRRGAEAPSALLTEEQVIEIRRRAERGATLGQLASEYGLSKPGIHHVISGRSWRHVEPVTSKYRNVRTVVDGKTFDSKREANRYMQLLALQQRGEITELELQVPFVLAPAVVLDGRKKTELRYVADFVYEKEGKTVIEDVKGKVTAEYRIKRHLMAARGLFITEVK